jgi:hypothetical protein
VITSVGFGNCVNSVLGNGKNNFKALAAPVIEGTKNIKSMRDTVNISEAAKANAAAQKAEKPTFSIEAVPFSDVDPFAGMSVDEALEAIASPHFNKIISTADVGAFDGLSDEELFAVIVKKYGGGTTDEARDNMYNTLVKCGLMTIEQRGAIYDAIGQHYLEALLAEERKLGADFNWELFIQNYRFSFDDLLSELKGLSERNPNIAQHKDFLQNFTEKAASVLSEK